MASFILFIYLCFSFFFVKFALLNRRIYVYHGARINRSIQQVNSRIAYQSQKAAHRRAITAMIISSFYGNDNDSDNDGNNHNNDNGKDSEGGDASL